MTARYQGPGWLLPIVQRCDLPWFDRITQIDFVGSTNAKERLCHVARLKHLQQLVLHETGVSSEFVTELRREHPDWNIFHSQTAVQDDANRATEPAGSNGQIWSLSGWGDGPCRLESQQVASEHP